MPVQAETLMIFIPMCIALIVTPGVDMLFCLGQGMKSGPKAGVAASIGVATGIVIHTFLAALGLAALVKAHPLAFEVIKWMGVGYLIWIGISVLRNPILSLEAPETARSSVFQAWKSGILVNLLNPKISIFILALLPQFIKPENGSAFLQFIILGTILNLGGMVMNGMVGLFAGKIKQALTKRKRLTQALNRLTGFVFMGMAAKVALES